MIYAIAVVLALILDQAVKYWTNTTLALGEAKEFIPGVVELLHTQNKGAAFGFLQNVEAARWLFIALVVVFSVAVVVILSKNIIKGKFGRLLLALVMAGGLGNGIDRVVNGYVVDMFNFEFMEFAVFNIADIFLTVCGVLFCLWLIFHKPEIKAVTESPPPRPRRTSGQRVTQENGDYITQLKKPVVRARVELDQPRVSSGADPRTVAPSRPQEQRPQQPRPQQPRPQPTMTAAGDLFAEFASEARPVPAYAEKSMSKPVAPTPQPSVKAPAPAPKKSSTDFSLDDIIAEFSNK